MLNAPANRRKQREEGERGGEVEKGGESEPLTSFDSLKPSSILHGTYMSRGCVEGEAPCVCWDGGETDKSK